LTTIEIPGSRAEFAGLYCRGKKEPGPGDVPDPDTHDNAAAREEKSLLCSRCRTVVTGRQHTASINDSHIHTFFNPAGLVYEIACFRQARGCALHGRPTDEFSWFAGCTWQYAVCTTCQVHLGWFFSAPDDSFYGLITSRLIEE
jgi:hypothetical protein